MRLCNKQRDEDLESEMAAYKKRESLNGAPVSKPLLKIIFKEVFSQEYKFIA